MKKILALLLAVIMLLSLAACKSKEQKAADEFLKDMEKLIDTLVARDELIFWTAADVEAEYMQKLGILEYKVVEFRYLAARMKLKVQLLQKAAEEQATLLLPQVEKKLDEQLKDQMKQVVNRRRHLNMVLSRRPLDRMVM